MNQNDAGHNNLLDTTDCLEGVGVFKGWKNFIFIIIFLCLLLVQACFWLVDLGWVKIPAETPTQSSNQVSFRIPIITGTSDTNNLRAIAASRIETSNDGNTVVVNQQIPRGIKDVLDKITYERMTWALKFVNAILILSATLYCLTILFSLKLSILGRLGGINHITRAFFLSMFLLIFLLPWQLVFDSSVIGAIFTSNELIRGVSTKSDVLLDKILYYLRFSGYDVLILLLLILAQIRSCRWAGAILRRLELI
jgi:hypothetical protein